MANIEKHCTLLLQHDSTVSVKESDLQKQLESKNEETKIEALRQIILLTLNGEQFPRLLMPVIKFCLHSENNAIKKLLLCYWEVVEKHNEKGVLLHEMILVCNAMKNNLEHPNEYIRGSTLRYYLWLRLGCFFVVVCLVFSSAGNNNSNGMFVYVGCLFLLNTVICREFRWVLLFVIVAALLLLCCRSCCGCCYCYCSCGWCCCCLGARLIVRFLCRIKESEILESLIPSVTSNLEHRHSYVRKNAVLTGPTLLWLVLTFP
jgi:hypothetical protein